ncbi:MAG TPA: class I SAM-dependent methyltransferase [Kiritimatiellia bacterium]|nr:class I SAM-dependent methyltransferase [Kiritimatiellia bacterium]HMP34301.1 class I SAM-dependent methyltransferase [Kiritimatiellia bacterium]
MDNMEYFLEIYGNLPRAGPGSSACTRRAYAMLHDVPEGPGILDIGCGPGVQTVELLHLSGGSVVALDFLASMLNRTRVAVADAGMLHRVELLEQDMRRMDFAPGRFDIIWSEGAIYNLGFEQGLRKVMPFVRPGGYVAVSDAVWLKPDPPAPVVALWNPYPEIDTVENKRSVIERIGYALIGDFVLPAETWTDEYYDPMERLLAIKAEEWRDSPEGMAVVEEARQEIAVHRNYADYYSYGFFVMRRRPE